MNYDTYYKYSKRRVKNTKSRLLKLQEKILKETIKIDEELLKRFEDENDLLDDYEIEFELKFILKEDDKEFKEDNDNFIATITEYLKEISKNKHNFLWSLDENHSDLSKTHPMSDFSHSWWFHCLYDHCHISWEDMLRIGDFWSDVKVTYQYLDKKQK